MIKLHQFVRTWGIPNLSHFCCKLETYLRLTNIPYQIVHNLPLKSPKGKLPFIEDGDKKIADSDLIIQHLIKKHGDKLDADLNPSEKAISLAMRRLIEEHLLSQHASSKLCTLVQGFSCYTLCYCVVYGRTKTEWSYDNKLNGSFGLGHEI